MPNALITGSQARALPPGSSGVSPDVTTSYADLEPGLGFAEWRLEVLSLLEAT